MTNKKYFVLEDSPYNPGYKTIRIDFEVFPKFSTEGNFNILAARLLHLDYADFCRLCRDEFDAKIIGKNNLYPTIYFPNRNTDVTMLIRLLNSRLNAVVWLQEHPDWREHKEYLDQFKRAGAEEVK